jgi:hypothetical protein
MTANGFSDKKFYKLKDAYEQNFNIFIFMRIKWLNSPFV